MRYSPLFVAHNTCRMEHGVQVVAESLGSCTILQKPGTDTSPHNNAIDEMSTSTHTRL